MEIKLIVTQSDTEKTQSATEKTLCEPLCDLCGSQCNFEFSGKHQRIES